MRGDRTYHDFFSSVVELFAFALEAVPVAVAVEDAVAEVALVVLAEVPPDLQ